MLFDQLYNFKTNIPDARVAAAAAACLVQIFMATTNDDGDVHLLFLFSPSISVGDGKFCKETTCTLTHARALARTSVSARPAPAQIIE